MKQSEFVENALEVSNGDRNQAVEMVRVGILSGECPYSKITPETTEEDRQKLAKSYSSALVANELKKNPKWNGGEKYTPKNPRGPRANAALLKEIQTFEKQRDIARQSGLDEEHIQLLTMVIEKKINILQTILKKETEVVVMDKEALKLELGITG